MIYLMICASHEPTNQSSSIKIFIHVRNSDEEILLSIKIEECFVNLINDKAETPTIIYDLSCFE